MANGVWERLLNIFINDPDFEWLMIDSTFVKAHKAGVGIKIIDENGWLEIVNSSV